LESQGECVEEIGLLLVHGGEIGADRTEGIGPLLGSEAARDSLFDLGHANGLLGEVVGERDVVVGREAPDVVGIDPQSPEEVCRFALSGSATFSGAWGERIERFAFREDSVIAKSVVGEARGWQRVASLIDLLAGGAEQVNLLLSPSLAQLLEDVGQFAQMMGIAQAMLAEQFAVRLPAVVNQRTHETGQDRQRVKGFLAPLGVARHPGQHRRGQNMHPVQRPCNPQAGFVSMRDGCRLDRLADRCHGRLKPVLGFFAGGEHRGLGHRQREQVAHQRRRALYRQHVVMTQMNHGGQGRRSVLHRCTNAFGKLAVANLAAGGTLTGKNLMLGNLEAQNRKIEHLTGLHHGNLDQRRLARVAARRRRMRHHPIHFGNFLQRVPAVPSLPACGLASRLPQRLRLRLAETIRGRWLTRIPAVLRQPRFQIHYLRLKHRHLCHEIAHQRTQHSSRIKPSFSATLRRSRSGSSSMHSQKHETCHVPE